MTIRAALLAVLVAVALPARAADLTVAAANSTCGAITAAGSLFADARKISIDYICKSSGRLAKGLMGGSITADYYISANKAWMDRMVEGGQIDGAAVVSLWGNDLVVATPKGSPLRAENLETLAGPAVSRVMIGDPGTAPFGRYAKQSLEGVGVWDRVRPKIVTRKHITLLADNLAEADGSTVGILFSTNLNPGLRRLFLIPEALHAPIRYYSAPMKGRESAPLVAAFAEFLGEEAAGNVFRDAGFVVRP